MNRIKIIGIICALLLVQTMEAQKYFTRNGNISFLSEAPLEKIEAVNQKASSVMDVESGRIEFAVLIKAFHFEKALMQEHFNENYMESSKYPKAKFKGYIVDISKVDFSTDGTYPVRVKGTMMIHGVSNEIEVDAVFIIQDGEISARSNFELAVADYDIKIPKVVKDNIAKTVMVRVALDYELFRKS